VKATLASRSMVVSGLVVLTFIFYHIAHFTVRVTDPRFALLKADPLNRYDVFSMMVYGFQNPIVSAFYVLAILLLTLHLTHGTSSFFQSLGLNDKQLTPKLARWGRIYAWCVFVGYVSMPIAVLFGLVLPAEQVCWARSIPRFRPVRLSRNGRASRTTPNSLVQPIAGSLRSLSSAQASPAARRRPALARWAIT
jgi:hypothetical protein